MNTTKLMDADTFENIRQTNSKSTNHNVLPEAFKVFPTRKFDDNGNIVMSPPPVAPSPVAPVTCFPAGSQVLMADGTTKNIEDVQVGEMLATINGESVACVKKDVTILGFRDMVEFDDESLMWSEEHAFWTKDADGNQWWWSFSPDQWRFEVEEGVIGGLEDNYTIRTGEGFEFATVNGWERKTPRVTKQKYGFETPLYLPVTNGAPIIVNGYVVGAGVNEAGYDYKSLNWNGLVQVEEI
jgi:hypothetical protein